MVTHSDRENEQRKMIETYLSIGKGKELMAEPPAEISTYLPIKALRSMLKT